MSEEEKGCSLCGCVGIHACTGHPIGPWPPEKIEELRRVLAEYEPEPASDAVSEDRQGDKNGL